MISFLPASLRKWNPEVFEATTERSSIKAEISSAKVTFFMFWGKRKQTNFWMAITRKFQGLGTWGHEVETRYCCVQIVLLVSLRHEDMRSWGELETRGEDGGRGYISSLSKLPSGTLAPSLPAACLVNQCLCRHYLLESKLSNPGVIKLMAWLSSKACQLSIVGKTELPESMKHWSNSASDFEICTYDNSFQTFTSLKYM